VLWRIFRKTWGVLKRGGELEKSVITLQEKLLTLKETVEKVNM